MTMRNPKYNVDRPLRMRCKGAMRRVVQVGVTYAVYLVVKGWLAATV